MPHDDLNDEFDDSDVGQLGAVRFDQLTATDFEEFCFDLLAEIGSSTSTGARARRRIRRPLIEVGTSWLSLSARMSTVIDT